MLGRLEPPETDKRATDLRIKPSHFERRGRERKLIERLLKNDTDKTPERDRRLLPW